MNGKSEELILYIYIYIIYIIYRPYFLGCATLTNNCNTATTAAITPDL
jgi:hypothetical protein